jgi:hypothetical protein
MASKKITELNEATSVVSTDLLVIVKDPAGAASTQKVRVSTLFANTIIAKANTPTNSTPTITRGSIFFDDNYLYIATNTNTLKRIALSAF